MHPPYTHGTHQSNLLRICLHSHGLVLRVKLSWKGDIVTPEAAIRNDRKKDCPSTAVVVVATGSLKGSDWRSKLKDGPFNFKNFFVQAGASIQATFHLST